MNIPNLKLKSLSVMVLATLSTAAFPQTATSQNGASPAAAPANKQQLEEVIVTARKRGENIQTAPLAISAFTAETLQQSSSTNLPDIAKFTSSLFFVSTPYDPFSSQPSLRGQGTADPLLEAEAPIGVYIDGVYVATTLSTNVSSLLGVERVEVLKGPQGTLYGRNTTGGAISVITALPNYDGINGEVRLRAGNFKTYAANGLVNIPIVDHLLSAQIAAGYNESDGYGKDLTTGRPLNDVRSQNFRGALRFDPTDKLQFVLRADYSKNSSSGLLQKLVLLEKSSPTITNVAVQEASSGKLISPAFSGSFLGALFPVLTGTATPAQFAIFGQGTAQSYQDILNSVPSGKYDGATSPSPELHSGVNVEASGGSLTGTYAFNNDLSLKSITAYRTFTRKFQVDSDATPFLSLGPNNSGDAVTKLRQFTQEFNLNGTALGGSLKYLLGAFYYDSSGIEIQNTFAIPFINPSNPTTANARVDDTSKAVFGQATYSFANGLNLTAGVRQTKETKTLTSANTVGTTCNIPVSVQVGGQCKGIFSNSFDNTSYTVSLDYSLDKNTLVYFRTGSGFKAGGQNQRITLTNAAFANFGPENVTDYEVGVKSDLLNRRLRINADYYYSKYTDIQQSIVIAAGAGVTSIVANSGSGTIDGVELEVQALPIDPLLLRLSANLTNPKYTKGAPANSNGLFQNVPKKQYSVSAVYTLPTSVGDAKFGMDYAWQDLVDFQNANHDAISAPYAQQTAYGLLNGRVSLELKGNTSIALYGKNLTNRYYITGALDVAGAGFGFVTTRPGEPRTFGLELTHQF